MIRIFIVAVSLLPNSGLDGLLKSKTVKVSGRAAKLESAAAQISDTRTDVLLVDANGQRPEQFVQALVESDLASDSPTVVLVDDPRVSSAALLRSGVRGVLSADVSSEQLLAALEAVVSGLDVLQPEAMEALTATRVDAPHKAEEPLEALTPREHEVLQMLAAGLGNKEIASRLTISEHTVKFHVASILGKLGAASRTEAVSLAIRQGLILL